MGVSLKHAFSMLTMQKLFWQLKPDIAPLERVKPNKPCLFDKCIRGLIQMVHLIKTHKNLEPTNKIIPTIQ